MGKRIVVLGTGAIGSSVAADLAKAKCDVTIMDQWPEHVEAMKARGLRVEMPDETLEIPVQAHHVCELASLNREFDVVLLAVKAYDSRWMAELIKPYLKKDGVLLGLQNGMTHDDHASIVGRERTVGCVIELSAEIFTPGVVQRNTARSNTWFGVGELDGSMSLRLQEVQSILSHAAKVDITDNIYGAKWSKLVVNSMTMGPEALLGLTCAEAAKLPGMSDVSVRLGKETLAVGTALGYQIEPIFGLSADDFAGSDDQLLVTAMRTLLRHIGERARTAPVHDHLKGRRSEIGYINGLVVRRGGEVDVPTPANEIIVEMDRLIDQKRLQMDPSNFDLLKARL